MPIYINSIVNDIRNFIYGLAEVSVYGFCKSREQKFVMSFTIYQCHGAGVESVTVQPRTLHLLQSP